MIYCAVVSQGGDDAVRIVMLYCAVVSQGGDDAVRIVMLYCAVGAGQRRRSEDCNVVLCCWCRAATTQ